MSLICEYGKLKCHGNHCLGCESHMPKEETRRYCWQCRRWQRIMGNVPIEMHDREDVAPAFRSYGT